MVSRLWFGFGWYLGLGLLFVGIFVGVVKLGGGGNFGVGIWVLLVSFKKWG